MRRAGFLPRYPQKNTGRLRGSCFYLSYQYSADGTVARNTRQTRFFEGACTLRTRPEKNRSLTTQFAMNVPSEAGELEQQRTPRHPPNPDDKVAEIVIEDILFGGEREFEAFFQDEDSGKPDDDFD